MALEREPYRALSPAALRISSEISAHGPMTFARFMDIALYEPGVGYYERSAAEDFDGDYVTSPQLHPAFGVLICGQLEEMWRHLDRPSHFWLVEGGPGTGCFAADVLATAEDAFPDFAHALHIGLLERSAALRTVQERTLARWSGRVCWLSSGTEDALGAGCLFANEVLDAFSVHRVVGREGGLREIYVDMSRGGFVEVEEGLSTPEIEDQISVGGGRLRPGDRGEVNLEAGPWLTSAANLIERGYVLLFDYGEPADLLYGPRHPRGTLRCYWRHTMNEEPLHRVGLQDITAHVDLTAVARAGGSSGLSLLGATHQAGLLMRLGLDSIRTRIRQEVPGRAEQRAHSAALDLLTDSRHLGRVSVLLFGAPASRAPLVGFREGSALHPPSTDRALEIRIPDTVGLVASLSR